MKSLIIALFFLFAGHSSFCQEWVYVGADTDGDKWYVKSSYIKKEGFNNPADEIRIWTKKELKKTTIKKNGKSLTYTNAKELQLIVVNCTDKQIKFVTTTVYNSQGKVIDSYTLEEYEQEWVDVVPDSMGEAMLNKICGLFN
jgi:hypothetical protein